MSEQFTPEELAAIRVAVRHLDEDHREAIGDQLRLVRDSDAFATAKAKLEARVNDASSSAGRE